MRVYSQDPTGRGGCTKNYIVHPVLSLPSIYAQQVSPDTHKGQKRNCFIILTSSFLWFKITFPWNHILPTNISICRSKNFRPIQSWKLNRFNLGNKDENMNCQQIILQHKTTCTYPSHSHTWANPRYNPFREDTCLAVYARQEVSGEIITINPLLNLLITSEHKTLLDIC